MRWKITFLFIFMMGSYLMPDAYADEAYTFIVKKQEVKDKYRGWLFDWFETRDRMRMQDLWLALHSPSPYEFYLGGNYQINQTSAGQTFNGWETYFAAFTSIFGLEARYETGLQQRLSGIFDLRIFGYYDQATNVTLQVGIRNDIQGGDTALRNALAGFSMTLYFARKFGIEGLYRHFFPSTPTASGVTVMADRYQVGAFLDFRFLRLYGDYFSEGATTGITTSGTILGTKLYF